MWKEVVVAYLEVLSQYLPSEGKKTTEILVSIVHIFVKIRRK
jgi:hypothetical protein